jgi:transcriptional regulator with XRE-family HTH domain
MNAAEARKARGGTTLVDRTKRDPRRAARIKQLVDSAAVEQIVEAIMAASHVTAADLARRLNAKAPQVSRDLHGGLRRATLTRLGLIAKALDHDFVPVLVPRADSAERDRFFEAYSALVPSVLEEVPDSSLVKVQIRKAKKKHSVIK